MHFLRNQEFPAPGRDLQTILFELYESLFDYLLIESIIAIFLIVNVYVHGCDHHINIMKISL